MQDCGNGDFAYPANIIIRPDRKPTPMNIRIITPVLFLLVGGCASTPPATTTAQTLQGDPQLPGAEIEPLCTPEQWNLLGAMKYRAFVVLNGESQLDGSVTTGVAQASYPDSTWVEPARAVVKNAVLKVSTTGSHIPPAADVFVIFYGHSEGNRRALVYARQRDDSLPGTFGKAQYIAVEKY